MGFDCEARRVLLDAWRREIVSEIVDGVDADSAAIRLSIAAIAGVMLRSVVMRRV